MSYEMKDDTGVLFKNERKEKENQPDYTGKIKIGGKERQLAAWIKEGNKGKYMSIRVSDFRNAADGIREGMRNAKTNNATPEFDDSLDIPF